MVTSGKRKKKIGNFIGGGRPKMKRRRLEIGRWDRPMVKKGRRERGLGNSRRNG